MTTRPVVLPAPTPGLELVVDRKLRVPRIRSWLIFTLAVIAAFFLLIYSRIALDRSAFDLKDIEEQIAVEETRYWNLQLDVARLDSPQRIMEAATEMGLVYPSEVRKLTVPIHDARVSVGDDRWAEVKALLGAQP